MNAVEHNPIEELLIRADVCEVSRATAWLKSASFERGVPEVEINRLELCLHEVLANIIAHGKTPSFSIGLQLDISRCEATVTVSDSCVACNPLAISPQPIPKTLAEANPGGLGVLIIRKTSDTQSYRYHEGQNRFTFGVRWKTHE